MVRFRWLVRALGILVLVTVLLYPLAGTRHAAMAVDAEADLLKRLEALESRVDMLEKQLAGSLRLTAPPATQPPSASRYIEPRYWGKFEFNGAPVYIIPLGDAEAKQ